MKNHHTKKLRPSGLSTLPCLVHGLCVSAGLLACNANQTPISNPPPADLSCVPNRDGQISADEIQIATTAANYIESPAGVARTVNSQGTGDATARRWDFSTEFSDDQDITITPTALGAQWYASQFPDGEFVIDAGSGLDAIYSKDDRALWLWGTASHVDMPASAKTIIRYPTPVPALRFPVVVGNTDDVTVAITGATIAGLPFVGTDRFQIAVADAGQVEVPYVRFSPALKVTTIVTRIANPGGATFVRRSLSFLFECFGEVVHIDSAVNEANPDFTNAALLRRFRLP
ncbi:MAG: hypothetical protein KBG15_23130 [Kofleriaceae bacterium]|nr:hypothetical protein [Kofleriaceae bacterium]